MELYNLRNAIKKNITLAIIILLLVLGNIFFAVTYFLKAQEVAKLQKQVTTQQINAKTASFLNLFIQKVLKTDKEVAFEDRLKLENAIRDINDPELLQKWEEFTGGTNEVQIQQGVKDLLEALAKKLVY